MTTRLQSLSALMASAGIAHPGQIPAGLFSSAGVSGADGHARVMNAFSTGNPAIGGMGFNVNIYEQIVSRAFDVQYPEIEYPKFIPAGAIDTSVSPGAVTASAIVKDWRGKGAFRAVVGKDIPTVSVSAGKISVPLEAGGISGNVDLEDVRRVAFGFQSVNMLTAIGEAMRKGYELHREVVFFYGFSPLGFDGYLNSAQVSATTAAVKAATGTTWAVATAAEIVADFITATSTVVTQTRGVYRPNRYVVPLAQYLKIAGMNIGGTGGSLMNETVLSYLLRTLPALAGGPVEIVPLRDLNDAGVGGTARMIVETVNNDTFYMPDAVPFNMLPPQDVQYATHLFADYKFGGLLRPQPRSALYVDGI